MENLLNIHPYNLQNYLVQNNLNMEHMVNHINDNINDYNAIHNLNQPLNYYINDVINQNQQMVDIINNDYVAENNGDGVNAAAGVNNAMPVNANALPVNANGIIDNEQVNYIINNIIANDPHIANLVNINIQNNVDNIQTHNMILIHHINQQNNHIVQLQNYNNIAH